MRMHFANDKRNKANKKKKPHTQTHKWRANKCFLAKLRLMNSCLVTQAHYFFGPSIFLRFTHRRFFFFFVLSLGFVSGFRFVFDDTSSPLYSFQFSACPMASAHCAIYNAPNSISTLAKLFQFIFVPCDGFFFLRHFGEQFDGGPDGVYWPVTHASQHRNSFTRTILFLSRLHCARGSER